LIRRVVRNRLLVPPPPPAPAVTPRAPAPPPEDDDPWSLSKLWAKPRPRTHIELPKSGGGTVHGIWICGNSGSFPGTAQLVITHLDPIPVERVATGVPVVINPGENLPVEATWEIPAVVFVGDHSIQLVVLQLEDGEETNVGSHDFIIHMS
jgi:hypothetical protein